LECGFVDTVKLISPQFVRPFVKSNKNDFVDAEAICEAASRPAMRFVAAKTESQHTLSAMHRVRDSLVRDRTKTSNQMHGWFCRNKDSGASKGEMIRSAYLASE
jgi:transposase